MTEGYSPQQTLDDIRAQEFKKFLGIISDDLLLQELQKRVLAGGDTKQRFWIGALNSIASQVKLETQTPIQAGEKGKEDSLVGQWIGKIKKAGAASVYGKFHSGRFADDTNLGNLTPLTSEPGYARYGHINIPDKKGVVATPLIEVEIGANGYGHYGAGEIKFPEFTQFAFLGPSEVPGAEFNRSVLGGRFTSPWREINYSTKMETDPLITPCRREPVAALSVFLPDQEAVSLFADINNHPDLPSKIMTGLYPKIAFKPIKNDFLFTKEIRPEELKLDYAGAITKGGRCIPINKQSS